MHLLTYLGDTETLFLRFYLGEPFEFLIIYFSKSISNYSIISKKSYIFYKFYLGGEFNNFKLFEYKNIK